MADQPVFVSYRVENGIAVLTVDRPPVNAWNLEVQDQFEAALAELAARREVRVILVTGGGEKAFIAGADLEMISRRDRRGAAELSASTQAVLGLIAGLPQVVIAVVNGLALGGGAEVALACDLRVADEKAVFGFPEVGLGLLPGAGGTQRLARLVGPGKAKELILTGDPIPAAEAHRIGLVERLAPQGEAMNEAGRLAGRIMLRGPAAVAKAKRAIGRGLELPLEDGLRLETELFGQLFETEDLKEGLAAFFEKRRPVFTGE